MAEVLIIDDDTDLAAAESEIFQLEGYDTRVAHNGNEGLAALCQRFPDAIVLDIEMPVLDGPGMALEMFVQDAGREKIPIVLTSGDVALVQAARSIGTPYYVAKPCGIDTLLDLTARALRERIAPTPAIRARDEAQR